NRHGCSSIVIVRQKQQRSCARVCQPNKRQGGEEEKKRKKEHINIFRITIWTNLTLLPPENRSSHGTSTTTTTTHSTSTGSEEGHHKQSTTKQRTRRHPTPPDKCKASAASTVPPRWLLLYVVSILSALYAPGPLLAKQKITTRERTQTKGRPDAGETAREDRQVEGISTSTNSAALKKGEKKTRHVINFIASLQCTQRERGGGSTRERTNRQTAYTAP
ncbi:unnamed protein product, partial [Ectocarpus sp. 8 AP-2014]